MRGKTADWYCYEKTVPRRGLKHRFLKKSLHFRRSAKKNIFAMSRHADCGLGMLDHWAGSARSSGSARR
jgi:hypothetical protein